MWPDCHRRYAIFSLSLSISPPLSLSLFYFFYFFLFFSLSLSLYPSLLPSLSPSLPPSLSRPLLYDQRRETEAGVRILKAVGAPGLDMMQDATKGTAQISQSNPPLMEFGTNLSTSLPNPPMNFPEQHIYSNSVLSYPCVKM